MAATSLCRQLQGSTNGIDPNEADHKGADHDQEQRHLRSPMDRVLTNRLVKVNRVQPPADPGMKTAAPFVVLAFALLWAAPSTPGAEEPALIEVVDFSKLLPLLPNPPADWTADKAEGSTDDIGGPKSRASIAITKRARRHGADHVDQHSRFSRES